MVNKVQAWKYVLISSLHRGNIPQTLEEPNTVTFYDKLKKITGDVFNLVVQNDVYDETVQISS